LTVTALAILISSGLVVAAIAIARSTTETEHASNGEVSATFSYRYDASNVVSQYTDLRLRISRAGKALQNQSVSAAICGGLCWPASSDALSVTDVEGDGEPDVLLNLYSGGAHCCYLVQVFRYDPTKRTYEKIEHVWGDPGYALKRLDESGPLEFVSADDRFAYEFAAYAFSGLPLEIFELRDGRFIDVTRNYPKLIGRDAAGWWRSYLAGAKGSFALGYLAAWAADEYNLDRSAVVVRTLKRLETAHELRSSSGFGLGGAAFVAHLERFLAQAGYAK
jgi:hypothetical protein